MKKILWSAPIIALAVLAAYILKFHNIPVSDDSSKWGTLGDYFGGLLNPILSFISLVYLTRTIELQQEANSALLEQSKSQQKSEEKSEFDKKFYNLITAQQQLLTIFEIKPPLKLSQRHYRNSQKKLYSIEAIAFIEDHAIKLINSGRSRDLIKSEISKIDHADSIFSLVRRFSLLISTIEKNAHPDEKNSYYELAINLTEYKLICLICMYCALFEEENFPHCQTIQTSGIFEKYQLSEYYDAFAP